MPMPTVNISATGTGGPIDEGEQFAWTTVASGSITVRADGPSWFTPNPCTFTGPASGPLSDNSNVVTAGDQASPIGGWGYSATCITGYGHVVVVPTMEEEKAG